MYPAGQVSKILSIPPSTLRRYVSKFKEYLSGPARRNRSRIFNDTDLTVLFKIRELTNEGVKLDDIPDRLAELVEPKPVTQEYDQHEQTALMAVIRLTEHVTSLETELATLREQVKKLAVYQTMMAEYQAQLEEWEALPNWQRIKIDRPKPPTFND